MLVLTRRLGEEIRIGDDVSITVMRIEKGRGEVGKVRIGITAPRDVKIIRGELAACDCHGDSGCCDVGGEA